VIATFCTLTRLLAGTVDVLGDHVGIAEADSLRADVGVALRIT
jgi:hypothetical protein